MAITMTSKRFKDGMTYILNDNEQVTPKRLVEILIHCELKFGAKVTLCTSTVVHLATTIFDTLDETVFRGTEEEMRLVVGLCRHILHYRRVALKEPKLPHKVISETKALMEQWQRMAGGEGSTSFGLFSLLTEEGVVLDKIDLGNMILYFEMLLDGVTVHEINALLQESKEEVCDDA